MGGFRFPKRPSFLHRQKRRQKSDWGCGDQLRYKTSASKPLPPDPDFYTGAFTWVQCSMIGACSFETTFASATRSLLRAKSLASLGCAMYTRLRAGALTLSASWMQIDRAVVLAVSACCAAALMLRSKLVS